MSKLNDKNFLLYQKQYQEFIDLAGHDLDAPLRKLSLLMERMLSKVKAGEDIDQQVARIQSCLTDMRGMVDGLTTLSNLSKPFNGFVKTNLQQLAEETIADIQKKEPGKAFSVRKSELPMVDGDPSSLKILMGQLISNSICFSSQERPLVIEITTATASVEEKENHQLDTNKIYYKILFTDNGTGFAELDAERIFQPFVRLHGKSAYPGYGMGLPLCRRIAENHQGRIYANTNEIAGAQFVLLLPQSLA